MKKKIKSIKKGAFNSAFIKAMKLAHVEVITGNLVMWKQLAVEKNEKEKEGQSRHHLTPTNRSEILCIRS